MSINTFKFLSILAIFCVMFGILANFWVWRISKDFVKTDLNQLEKADAVIILGAYVAPNGALSWILKDRLDTGLAVYERGLAPKILVTGDHGQTEYNEVQAMKDYLLAHGVPAEDVFMDHAGFDTYDSMYRARDVFLVERAIAVSQNFHVPLAVYVGRRLGLEVQGLRAQLYYPWWYRDTMRDWIARVKAFIDAELLHAEPKYLGDVLPISGDGRVTQD